MRNLALAFCSIRPEQLSEEVCDYREKEYLTSLQQIERLLPESFDLLICENTINSEDQIKNTELKEYLSNSEIVSLGSDANLGKSNKGMGELLMLKTALQETDIDKYANITYISARHLLTCPYVFEKTEQLQKQALISNPDFVYLDGKFDRTYKIGLYNDMIFSMKSSVMLDYANYAMNYVNPNQSQYGSEQVLYNFINENNVEYEWLEWLGVIRNAWCINQNIFDINNFHFC
jgi:hypothetical protein